MRVVVKSVVTLLFLIFGFCPTYSQGWIADSLNQILTKKDIPDTTRVNALIHLADFYCEVNADTSILFTQQAKKIVEQKGLTRFLPRVYRYMAIALVVKGDYITSIDYLRKAIRKCDADSSRFLKNEKALAYNLMGIILVYQSNYDSALHYYFDALAILRKLNDTLSIAHRYNNVANVYKDMGNYPLALKYYFEAEKIKLTDRGAQNIGETYLLLNEPAKAKAYWLRSLALYDQDKEFDNTGVAMVNEQLGNLYSSAGKTDSAIYHLTRALGIYERAKYKSGIAQNHYYFGLHYKNRGQWDQVVREARIAMDLHVVGGEKLLIAESTLLLAEAHFQLGHLSQALDYSLQGVALAKEINAKKPQKGYFELLMRIYSAQKNYSTAYSYSQQLNALKDSINNEEKIKQVANMEALYENDKKEKELAVVRAEKMAADARLGQEETKATLLIVGLSLAALVLVIGAFSYLALKKNRKILETKNEELRKLNQTKDRFFAIVGHDLRGPITSFSGINDLLNWYISKNDMEKVKAFGGKITQSVRQLDTLLNNLLNWAMSQTNAIPYRPEPLQINQLTKECYGYFEHSLEVKHLTLIDETTDDLFVFADKNALTSVLRNLVSNAIKFTPAKGSIKISTRLVDNMVWVDVQDTGVGISEAKLKTIFSLSESKTTSGTSGEKGTGLGLVLCADYVALNKGVIKAESKQGEGTVFSFSIPSFQPKELQQLKKEMIHG
jgi:two-component system, NtrC family, sensor kinase